MFTGIIEETGRVILKIKTAEGYRFKISARKVIPKLKVSDSISVNGVCHTVISVGKDSFEFVSVKETLKKTNVGYLKKGDAVNLETSLRAGDSIGGHFLYGHVDDIGTVSSITRLKNKNKENSQNYIYKIKLNKKHLPYVINVGSIAVNGVSLTVAEILPAKGNYFYFKVSIIPYTYLHTTFRYIKTGDRVNIELDILGKYVHRMLNHN